MGKILWLASCPKSGNTWMRAFLHNLMLDHPVPHDINRLDELTGGDVEPGLYRAISGREPEDIKIKVAVALRGRVQQRLAEPVDRVIELMGRDNAHTGISTTAMPDVVGSWSRHVVRYEDLLRAPARTFEQVVRFLGIPASSTRPAKAIKRSSFKVLANQEARAGFRERPEHARRFFRQGKAGGWKKFLSAEQARAIESRHREQMVRWGYLSPDDSGRRPDG